MPQLVHVGKLMGPPRGDSAPAAGSLSVVALAGSNIIGGAVDVLLDTGTSIVFGAPDLSNNQNLLEISKTTGQVVYTTPLFTRLNIDDHNITRFVECTNGTIVTAAAGHAEASTIGVRRSTTGALNAFAAEYTFATGGVSTYPHLIRQASTDHIFAYWRVGSPGNAWQIGRSINQGASFTNLGTFITNSSQSYLQADWLDADRLLFTAVANPDIGTTTIKVATVNCTTGDIVCGTGTLGSIYNAGTINTDFNDWTSLYTSPDSRTPGVSDVDGSTPAILFHLTRDDTQFYQVLVMEFTGADIFEPTDWTVTSVCDQGGGCGHIPADSAEPYYRPGGEAFAKRPGRGDLEICLGRLQYGTWSLEAWSRIAGTFRPTHLYRRAELDLSTACFRPNPIPSDAVPVNYYEGLYTTYNLWATGGMKTVLINSVGASAPTWVGAADFSIAERRHWTITMPWNQSATTWVSGGADAALFVADGDQLHLHSQVFASPIDDDADNVYEVEVTGMSLSGMTATQAVTVTITEQTLANSPLNKYTRAVSNAGGWALTGITATANSASVLDPFGTNLSARLTHITNASYTTRRSQTVTAPTLQANTRYTLQGKFRVSNSGTQSCNFAGLRCNDGNINFGASFDCLRGELSNPENGTSGTFGPIEYWGREQLANNFWAFWFEFITGDTIGTPSVVISVKHNGGSRFAEKGDSANYIYAMDVMLSEGTWSPFQVRTV
jgi:hypothetical protein